MCGIVGFLSKSKHSYGADEMLPELVFLNQMRGRDACGAFAQHANSKDIRWMKMAGNSDAFNMWKRPHEEIYKDAEKMRFAVFHNRSATIGDAKDVTYAHPHMTENIALVHNGTLRSGWDEKLKSDSKQLALWLEAMPDFRDVAKKINGAYALVWHDARDDSLNFVRNYERPLFFVEALDGTEWFASEPWMVEGLLKRKSRTVQKVTELPPHHWLKVLPDGKTTQTEIPWGTGDYALIGDGETKEIEKLSSVKAETTRSWNAIAHGGTHIPFKECEVDYGDDSIPFTMGHPPVISQLSQGGVQRKDENPNLVVSTANRNFIKLPEWGGLKPGSSVMFFPLIGKEGTTPDKTIVMGPMLGWSSSETPFCEFVGGVEIKASIADDWSFRMGKNFEDRMSFIRAQEIIHSAVIHNILYDLKRRRIIIWGHESSPEDWFNLEEYNMKQEDINAAYQDCYILTGEDIDSCNFSNKEKESLFTNGEVAEAIVEVSPISEKKTEGGAQQDSIHDSAQLHLEDAQGNSADSYVQVGADTGVRCDMCNAVVANVHASNVYEFFVKYNKGVTPKKHFGSPSKYDVQSERINVCETCTRPLTNFFNGVARVQFLGKIGYAPPDARRSDSLKSPVLKKLGEKACPTCGCTEWLSVLHSGKPYCVHCKVSYIVCQDTVRNEFFLEEVK